LVTYRSLYERSLQIGADNVSAATIPVEKAQAEIILVAGGDDALWPSDIFAKSIEERLASAGKHATFIHHPNARHRLLFRAKQLLGLFSLHTAAVMRRMRHSVARLGTRYQLFFGSDPRSLGCNSDGDTRAPDFTNGRRRTAATGASSHAAGRSRVQAHRSREVRRRAGRECRVGSRPRSLARSDIPERGPEAARQVRPSDSPLLRLCEAFAQGYEGGC
jgi:BAAT / Acyl-CoA thioester hydrolase C terminal